METKTCVECNEEKPKEDFSRNGFTPAGNLKRKNRCIPCDAVYMRRQFKQRVYEAIGGEENLKCSVCGYNRSMAAIEFHHLDPTEKESTIGRMTNYSYERIKKEVDKCVILCSNCHREVHEGVITL